MALVNCPECKNEISSEAKDCPKCGYMIVKPKRTLIGKIIFTINILFTCLIAYVMLKTMMESSLTLGMTYGLTPDSEALKNLRTQQQIGSFFAYFTVFIIWAIISFTLSRFSKKKR
jgi:ribosomal protein L40E